MAVELSADAQSMVADKQALRDEFACVAESLGWEIPSDSSRQRLMELMLADGVSPADNAFTREVLEMRYGGEDA
jgi:hypothetical protein